MKPAIVVAALVAIGTSLLAAVPAATADPASEVTVVWPEITRFNPTLTTYDVGVTNTGDRHLFYTWEKAVGWGNWTGHASVPDTGHLDLTRADQGLTRVRIWSCDTDQWLADGSCTTEAYSPDLEVRSRITVDADQGDGIGVGKNYFFARWAPGPPAVAYPHVSWELLDTDKTSLDTPIAGEFTPEELAATGRQYVAIQFTIPAGLPSGAYYMDVHMSVDTVDFGPLEGSINAGSCNEDGLCEIDVDTEPPVLTVQDAEVPATFYPVVDDYLDYLVIPATTPEETEGVLEVRDQAGALVYRDPYHYQITDNGYGEEVYWDGRTKSSRLAPDGVYTLTLTVSDWVGNKASWTGTVAVSLKRLQWKESRRTVSAAASRAAKPFVGKCSALASPPRGGPRGSLGFYSEAKCHGDARAGTVATTHGMYLPQSFGGVYDWAQVTLNGGPATTSARNYLVMGYLEPRKGKFIQSTVFRRGSAAHDGRRLQPNNFWDRKSDKPYIIWSNGLAAGSRYVVRSYTVRVRYRVLR